VDDNELVLEIYFKRKNSNITILIEQWSLIVFDKGKPKDLTTYTTLVRSIYTYSRILPAYTFSKNGFNYTLDTRVYFNDNLRTKYDYFSKKRHLINNSLSNVKLSIQYIDKVDIFKIEEDMVKDILYSSTNKLRRL
jgi:hypothetical protein